MNPINTKVFVSWIWRNGCLIVHHNKYKTKDGPVARPFSIAVDGVGYGLGGVDDVIVRIESTEVSRQYFAFAVSTTCNSNFVFKVV